MSSDNSRLLSKYIFKPPYCAKCKNEYKDVKTLDGIVYMSRCFILPCGHSKCEHCLQPYVVDRNKELVCQECNTTHTFIRTANLRYVTDYFPQNYYVTGIANVYRFRIKYLPIKYHLDESDYMDGSHTGLKNHLNSGSIHQSLSTEEKKSIADCQNLVEELKVFRHKYNSYVEDVLHSIDEFFVTIHGKLQLLQSEMYQKLDDHVNSVTEQLNNIQINVNESERKLASNNLNTKKYVLKNLNKLKNIKLPEKMEDIMKFQFNDNIKVQNFCNLKRSYGLIKTVEGLMQNFISNKGLGMSLQTTRKTNEVTHSSVANMVFEESNDIESIASSNSSRKANLPSYYRTGRNTPGAPPGSMLGNSTNYKTKPTKFSLELSNTSKKKSSDEERVYQLQKVYVSYINGPDNIYVRYTDINSTNFEEYKIAAQSQNQPTNLKIGALYFVKYYEELWYRGKLLAMEIGNTPENCQLLLIDFGNIVEVPLHCLRYMTKSIEIQPYAATPCKIFGITPKNRMINLNPDKLLMNDIVAHSKDSNYIFIYKHDDVMEIDLIVTYGIYQISMRELLLYKGNFVLSNMDFNRTQMNRYTDCIRSIDRLNSKPIKIQKYNNFKLYNSIKVLKAVTPFDFYIMNETVSNYENFMDDLKDRTTKLKIHLPKDQMLCLAMTKNEYGEEILDRVQIRKILNDGMVKVYFFDTADIMDVQVDDLYLINETILKRPAFITKCMLADVAPKALDWTEDDIVEFRKLINKDNLDLYVLSHIEPSVLNVTLSYTENRNRLNINAQMVLNNIARSVGKQSKELHLNSYAYENQNVSIEAKSFVENTPIIQFNKPNTAVKCGRMKVKLMNIVSPGEFYIIRHCDANILDSLQKNIQNLMEKPENLNNTIGEFELNAPYMVYLEDVDQFSIAQWFRGRITEILSPNNLVVFLCDFGITRNVTRSQLRKPLGKLGIANDAVIKCRLASIIPTGGDTKWTKSSIEHFRHVCDKAKDLGITSCGNDEDGTLSVILWGEVVKISAIAPTIRNWQNLNYVLLDQGVVDSSEPLIENPNGSRVKEQYDEIRSDIVKWLSDINEDENNTIDMSTSYHYGHTIKPTVTPIKSWIPPVPIKKTTFFAVARYVEKDGTIYLHEDTQCELINEITKVINDECEHKPYDSTVKWRKGDPCIARFSEDGLYHRAMILKKFKSDKMRIQFVDYGNQVICDKKDLRKECMLGDVPILVNKYYLGNIMEIEGKGLGDYLHQKIVNQIIYVRVLNIDDVSKNSSDPIACAISCCGCDINNWLITQKVAVEKAGAYRRDEEDLDTSFFSYARAKFKGYKGNSEFQMSSSESIDSDTATSSFAPDPDDTSTQIGAITK